MRVFAAASTAAAVAACDEGLPPTDTVIGRVSHIVDGDTFLVGKTRIRLCGIDAPAQGHPGYRQSAKFLQRMIEGKNVRCVPVAPPERWRGGTPGDLEAGRGGRQ